MSAVAERASVLSQIGQDFLRTVPMNPPNDRLSAAPLLTANHRCRSGTGEADLSMAARTRAPPLKPMVTMVAYVDRGPANP
jgi:hypothetical protein